MSPLAVVMRRITAMVSSGGACERNWNSYAFIHNKNRNRLHPQRANDLVYVFVNSRMVQKFSHPEIFADWVEEVGSVEDVDAE